MRPSILIVYFIVVAIVGGEIRIRGKVRKRHNTHRRHRAILPPCNFNESLIEDEWSLMEAIGHSKFIFTGKVLSVRKFKSEYDSRKKRSNLYTIYLRRVLKGDDGELKMFVKEEPAAVGLSGSLVTLERTHARENCAPAPRPRLSAIFLSDGTFNSGQVVTPHLRLLTDPVPLTLYHLDRINAAVKARVLNVRKIKRGIKPNLRVYMSYKLYVRQVMKGDIRELKSHVFVADERTLNGAIVFVDWLRTNKCAYKLYRHSSGIFLSDGFYESFGWRAQRLRLLYEPLPLSLYDLDRVNAALKDIFENVLFGVGYNIADFYSQVDERAGSIYYLLEQLSECDLLPGDSMYLEIFSKNL
ncbi:unnamed protein product [Leptidea sinapis]|uniref:Uncharacterized protein n=1 Tax=Leptidea sinapis TaxID=189913 RepID=A0A5E4QKX5_9NEOP|nr:unnamed protein product [Leptidea sinapis]